MGRAEWPDAKPEDLLEKAAIRAEQLMVWTAAEQKCLLAQHDAETDPIRKLRLLMRLRRIGGRLQLGGKDLISRAFCPFCWAQDNAKQTKMFQFMAAAVLYNAWRVITTQKIEIPDLDAWRMVVSGDRTVWEEDNNYASLSWKEIIGREGDPGPKTTLKDLVNEARMLAVFAAGRFPYTRLYREFLQRFKTEKRTQFTKDRLDRVSGLLFGLENRMLVVSSLFRACSNTKHQEKYGRIWDRRPGGEGKTIGRGHADLEGVAASQYAEKGGGASPLPKHLLKMPLDEFKEFISSEPSSFQADLLARWKKHIDKKKRGEADED